MSQRHHDDEGQPATDDWLYLTGQEESEARYDAGIRNTHSQDGELANDDQ